MVQSGALPTNYPDPETSTVQCVCVGLGSDARLRHLGLQSLRWWRGVYRAAVVRLRTRRPNTVTGQSSVQRHDIRLLSRQRSTSDCTLR